LGAGAWLVVGWLISSPVDDGRCKPQLDERAPAHHRHVMLQSPVLIPISTKVL